MHIHTRTHAHTHTHIHTHTHTHTRTHTHVLTLLFFPSLVLYIAPIVSDTCGKDQHWKRERGGEGGEKQSSFIPRLYTGTEYTKQVNTEVWADHQINWLLGAFKCSAYHRAISVVVAKQCSDLFGLVYCVVCCLQPALFGMRKVGEWVWLSN